MPKKGFIDLGDGVFKGKGLDALNKSRDNRNELIAMFGGMDNLPTSVMKAKKRIPTEDVDEHAAKRSYKNSKGTHYANGEAYQGTLKKAFGISGSGPGGGALSTFPQNIGRSMVLMYSNPGDTVFDPFAGHASRMELCIRAGRHYIGCDASKDFMQFNRKLAKRLGEEFPIAKIELIEGDSRKIPVKDEIGDFTITSPPYWDIEYYGDEECQMSNCKTYKSFLDSMQEVMHENYRALKPGAYAIWFINDFRKKGKFYFYHVDILKLGKRAGFIGHDIIISDLGRGFRDIFISQTVQQRILPKRHEYGIIFRKPPSEEDEPEPKKRSKKK